MSIDRIPLPVNTGALWVAARRDVAPDPDGALLRSNHATTVVCLNERHELERQSPDYVMWLVEHDGGRAIWFPTVNFAAGNLAHTLPTITAITDRIRDRQGVLVHCAMGQGRAGTMAVCVLMMLGAPLEQALRTVAENRTFGGPGGQSQWALVEALDRHLRAGGSGGER